MYAHNDIYVNEFLGHKWNKPTSSSNGSLFGKNTLVVYILNHAEYFHIGIAYMQRLDVAVLLGYTIFFNFHFTLMLSYIKPLGKAHVFILLWI